MLLADNVIEESIEIMRWAIGQTDHEGLLRNMDSAAYALITECDGGFKAALDRTKYSDRYLDTDAGHNRAIAASFIIKLNIQLDGKPWLYGDQPSFSDLAILPFVRQFAHTDLDWWSAQSFCYVQNWLDAFKASDLFKSIMTKYIPWKAGDDAILFPYSQKTGPDSLHLDLA